MSITDRTGTTTAVPNLPIHAVGLESAMVVELANYMIQPHPAMIKTTTGIMKSREIVMTPMPK